MSRHQRLRTNTLPVQLHAEAAAARTAAGAGRIDATQRLAAGLDHSPRVLAQRRRIEAAFGRGATGGEPVVQREKTGTLYHCAISHIPQAQKAWCYAATSVIVRRVLGEPDLTVRDVVKEYLVGTGLARDGLDAMPQGMFDEEFGQRSGYEQVAKLGLKEVSINKEDLMSMLEADAPVILGLGGHSRVIFSYDTSSGEVSAYDPLTDATEVWSYAELEMMEATIFCF